MFSVYSCGQIIDHCVHTSLCMKLMHNVNYTWLFNHSLCSHYGVPYDFPHKYGPCYDGFHPWLDGLLVCISCKFDTEALVGLRHLQASFVYPWANHGLGFLGGGGLEGGIRWWARVIPYNSRFCWGIKGFIMVTWWWVTIEAWPCWTFGPRLLLMVLVIGLLGFLRRVQNPLSMLQFDLCVLVIIIINKNGGISNFLLLDLT